MSPVLLWGFVSGTYVVVVTDFCVLGNNDRTLHYPNGFVVVPWG